MSDTVIVTGGFGALGREVVAELLARGVPVAAVDVAGGSAHLGSALVLNGVDLTDEAAVEAAYATVAERLGPIGGLVNVAGGFIWEPIVGGALASWDAMYRINLLTAVVSSRAALPHLLKHGGSIVNVGAAGAVNPGAGMAPYAASKAGVRALTESLAEELKGQGVRVNAVLPTIIDTPTNRRDMPDADPAAWVQPRSAAKVIAFLLSADAAPITGASIPLTLGG
jgi:NAD(P)-dependent dehydrogenase (short-subunit alcohol dehydrogenase family)